MARKKQKSSFAFVIIAAVLVAADRERSAALGLDRTPVIFVNGRRAELQSDVEKGLHDDIEAALAAKR